MKISTVVLMAGVAAGAVYLLKKSGTSQPPSAATPASESTVQAPQNTVQAPQNTAQASEAEAPVVSMVEETLHQHEGEDNPVVHAFEEAVSHTHQDA